jgi:hypothetical protein
VVLLPRLPSPVGDVKPGNPVGVVRLDNPVGVIRPTKPKHHTKIYNPNSKDKE